METLGWEVCWRSSSAGGAGGDGGGVQTHGPAGKADRLRQVLNTGVPAALGQSHAPGAARRWVALRGRPAPDLLRPGLQTSGLGYRGPRRTEGG